MQSNFISLDSINLKYFQRHKYTMIHPKYNIFLMNFYVNIICDKVDV